jgi:Spy/CpxP family protein refolding chaperone
MRSLITVLTVAMLIWLPVNLCAQGEAGGLVERFQDLNLTDDQETKIAEIRKECGPEIQKAMKELATIAKEEVEKVHAVLTPEQKEKLATLKEERKEVRTDRLCGRIAHLKEMHLSEAEMAKIEGINKEFHPKLVKAMEGFEGILTAAQKTARQEGLKEGKKRREIIASFKLTDDQKEKVEAVGKQLRTLIQEEMEKIRDVLSEAQKEKLQEFKTERRENARDHVAHRIANLKELNLTDEQKTKISEIRQEYRSKVHEAGNTLRGAVREVVEKVIGVLKG